MHDIEPHYKWRDQYVASEDSNSPFHGRVYDEFTFKKQVYNYFIHPQWDEFGSSTLYMKILFVDYDEHFAIIELIGEWNDTLNNDVMFLKREIIDDLSRFDIDKYVIICENVLNFHGSDNCYYEEWFEDINETAGWICMLNTHKHVEEEMVETRIHHYANVGGIFNDINWRMFKPKQLIQNMENLMNNSTKQLTY